MDAPRWSAKSAVKKDDQFTAVPDFIDGHDSEHLPMWGRLAASWHGMAPQRRVMVAASVIVFAGVVGAFAVLTLSDLSGSSPQAPAGPLSAQEPQGAPASVPALDPGTTAVTGLLNSTAPAPLAPDS